MPPGVSQVYLTTPPQPYPIFVSPEIGALALISLVVAGATLWIVTWRRPDVG